MTGFKPSPGDAVKVLVQRVPDFVGMLRMECLTPGGRGGWMTKTKWARFWLDQGKAYSVRGLNGPCRICGAYSKDDSRLTVYAPDPDAGKVIREETSFHAPVRLADIAYVIACGDCIARHSLVKMAGQSGYRTVGDDHKIVVIYQMRPHPIGAYILPVLYADIRPVQSGKGDLASVEIRPWVEPEHKSWNELMRV